MAQRPLIAQQALDFAPTGALQLLARRVELGLRGLTARKRNKKVAIKHGFEGAWERILLWH